MPFHLNPLGDDEANDLPHFEEDDDLGSVRDETLEEEAEDELMVEDRPVAGAPPPPAPLTRKSAARRGRKSARKKARPARRKKSKARRGGKAKARRKLARSKPRRSKRGKGKKRRR
jgi:hypothetical protein